MYEDWTDKHTASNWNADPTTHNPMRVEQLDILLSVLDDELEPGEAILDIGMGSGIVEELIFKRLPDAYVVGLDSSEAMVELAHARLLQYKNQYTVVMHDITQIASAKLPVIEYGIAISVQTIHNVPDEAKQAAFKFIYNSLHKGGLFLLLDRIAIDTTELFGCYRSLWWRQERLYYALMREGATYGEHVKTVWDRGDRPATLEQHLTWLREAGFEAACLHLHANRALFAARKVG